MDLVRDMGFFLSFFSTGNRRKKSVLTVVIFLMLFFLSVCSGVCDGLSSLYIFSSVYFLLFTVMNRNSDSHTKLLLVITRE